MRQLAIPAFDAMSLGLGWWVVSTQILRLHESRIYLSTYVIKQCLFLFLCSTLFLI